MKLSMDARILNLRAALKQIVDDESGRKKIIAEEALAVDDADAEDSEETA